MSKIEQETWRRTLHNGLTARATPRGQASAMLDPVVNFFTRIYQTVGHGLGLAVSFVL
jgi:hypothetical protein